MNNPIRISGIRVINVGTETVWIALTCISLLPIPLYIYMIIQIIQPVDIRSMCSTEIWSRVPEDAHIQGQETNLTLSSGLVYIA